tara:strand:+ start:138 stop:338 length:201 start_codon:yes stop_codon:yes gene_type:complete
VIFDKNRVREISIRQFHKVVKRSKPFIDLIECCHEELRHPTKEEVRQITLFDDSKRKIYFLLETPN